MVDYDFLNENFGTFLNIVYNIGYITLIPIICVLGLIFNIISFIVFWGLKEKIFLYLTAKTFAESLLLIIGAIPLYTSCDDCKFENTYLRIIIILVSHKFLVAVVYSLITILEIEIAFNRYIIIKSRDTNIIMVEKKDKLKLFLYSLFSISLALPYLFAHKIERKMMFSSYQYTLNLNDFGKSDFFYYFHTYFVLIIYYVINFVSILIIVPLNIVIIFEFKKFMKKKLENSVTQMIRNISNLSNHQEEAKNKSRRFTIMIITISFLFVFSRLFEALLFSFNIYNNYIQTVEYFRIYYTISNVLVHASTYIFLSLNIFIFYFLKFT